MYLAEGELGVLPMDGVDPDSAIIQDTDELLGIGPAHSNNPPFVPLDGSHLSPRGGVQHDDGFGGLLLHHHNLVLIADHG